MNLIAEREQRAILAAFGWATDGLAIRSGNGCIFETKIKQIDEIIRICDECESTWRVNENISEQTGIYLMQYFDLYGIPYGGILDERNYYWHVN